MFLSGSLITSGENFYCHDLGVLLVPSRQRPGMLLNSLHCTENLPTPHIKELPCPKCQEAEKLCQRSIHILSINTKLNLKYFKINIIEFLLLHCANTVFLLSVGTVLTLNRSTSKIIGCNQGLSLNVLNTINRLVVLSEAFHVYKYPVAFYFFLLRLSQEIEIV